MPLHLTDEQLTAVFEAARPLAVRDRDAFLQAVAELLQARSEIGNGDVHRTIRVAQRRFYDPPEFDEHAQPHRRMAGAVGRASVSSRCTGVPTRC
jgi:hypothetical protein